MLTYRDLQNSVKERATLSQGGTQFDTAVKNAINSSLFRIAREARWRQLRRKTTFDTVTSYTTGSGAGTFTNGSKNVTVTGATFITDGIQPGRRITLQGSNKTFTIKTITGETTLTIDINYNGTTITGTGTYAILPQEEYSLPVQVDHRAFLWHEDFGFPFKMQYITDQEFYGSGIFNDRTDTPTAYRMWGVDMVDKQPLEPSVVTIASSSSSDTSINVTVFGTVSGLPDYETITTNSSDGTTSVAGSKSFSSIERIVKESSTVGRISATTNSGNQTIVTLPVGDTTAGIHYSKVQLADLPNRVFPINVQYYKDPYRLVNDGDVHELGKDFDECIILLSVMKLNYDQNQQADGDRFAVMFQDELVSLRKTNLDKIDWFPKLKKRYSTRFPAVHPYLEFRQVGSQFGPSSL